MSSVLLATISAAEGFQILKDAASIIGIVAFGLALWQHYLQRRKDFDLREKETREREDRIYISANDKYLQYLNLCLEHHDIRIFEDPNDVCKLESDPDKKERQFRAMAILIGVLENGFVISREPKTLFAQKQQKDWEWYMDFWSEKEAFRCAWKVLREGYDDSFAESMDKRMSRGDASSTKDLGSPR